MFTSIDKALAAILGAVLYFAQLWLQVDLTWITAEMIQNIIPILTPIIVWAVPNKEVR